MVSISETFQFNFISFYLNCSSEITRVEAPVETVDWGTLRPTRRGSKLEEEEELSISLKPIPVPEEAVVEQAVTEIQSQAVRANVY